MLIVGSANQVEGAVAQEQDSPTGAQQAAGNESLDGLLEIVSTKERQDLVKAVLDSLLLSSDAIKGYAAAGATLSAQESLFERVAKWKYAPLADGYALDGKHYVEVHDVATDKVRWLDSSQTTPTFVDEKPAGFPRDVQASEPELMYGAVPNTGEFGRTFSRRKDLSGNFLWFERTRGVAWGFINEAPPDIANLRRLLDDTVSLTANQGLPLPLPDTYMFLQVDFSGAGTAAIVLENMGGAQRTLPAMTATTAGVVTRMIRCGAYQRVLVTPTVDAGVAWNMSDADPGLSTGTITDLDTSGSAATYATLPNVDAATVEIFGCGQPLRIRPAGSSGYRLIAADASSGVLPVEHSAAEWEVRPDDDLQTSQSFKLQVRTHAA